MRQDRNEALTAELMELLGEADFLRLVEEYGGIRLKVPVDLSPLVEKLGERAAVKLGQRYSRSYLRVPLARSVRARHYRAIGRSNAEIARLLGIAETSVDKLFRRMPGKPVKGSRDPRQIELFPR
ncbi:hypothetical protein [Mesorhizobium sp. 1M-11]|uniref:hypothetical protein n=1 Tax=Mesorhizobium sp. 1M-11 TaxID=1529006 RepID=UPI0006C763A7|nr:hypothetical protein [Mesorhizobium sp. 1M-11]